MLPDCDSIDAKDTLFLKELRAKGQVRSAQGAFPRYSMQEFFQFETKIATKPPKAGQVGMPSCSPQAQEAPAPAAAAAPFHTIIRSSNMPSTVSVLRRIMGTEGMAGGVVGGGRSSAAPPRKGVPTPKGSKAAAAGGSKTLGVPRPGAPKGAGLPQQGGRAIGGGGGGSAPRPLPPVAEEKARMLLERQAERQAAQEKKLEKQVGRLRFCVLCARARRRLRVCVKVVLLRVVSIRRYSKRQVICVQVCIEAQRRYPPFLNGRHTAKSGNERILPILKPRTTCQNLPAEILQTKRDKQREMAEEKERARRAKETERLAKLEQKRLEKEAKDRERAEQHAREQARRGIERERARLAKRYPLPDEELWEEQLQMGKQPAPWPESGELPCPPGFPASAFGDVVSAWACLQLFGTLMHLKRFTLNELMSALVNGSADGPGSLASQIGNHAFADAAEDLLDIIPAPTASSPLDPSGGIGGDGVEGVLRRVETRRMAAERGFAGLGFRREGARGRDARVLQARVLDPLGEVMRILRHIIKSEEAKPFVDVPSDEDAGVVCKKEKPEVKRPLDLGTILKRAENGWYDLEPGAEPPVASNSFGAGHAGIAYDVELMQQGWLEARGADSAIFEQARGVVDEFLALYETHVLNPLMELDKDIKCTAEERAGSGPGRPPLQPDAVSTHGDTHGAPARGGAGCGISSSSSSSGSNDEENDVENDPLDMVRHMGSEEYKRWSPAARSRALAWLCDEALSASTMNDLVRKVLEAREVVDRKDREIKSAVRQRLREQEATEARGYHNPYNRRGTEAEMIAARMQVESPEIKTLREMGSVKVRLKPLGLDRDRRRYWLLATGEDHRLFTERNGVWGCYARVSQLKALHRWLDRRGIRERTLKAAVREHLIGNLGVNAEELDISTGRSASGRARQGLDSFGSEAEMAEALLEEEDGQQYLGEPAEVAREKERERSAGLAALKGCGFAAEEQRRALQRLCSSFAVDLHSLRAAGLAFELKTSGWVMRDVAVHMGPNGLGLQLDVRHGGVLVDGHTTMPHGVSNPGQAAGVQVGDLLVSVDNIVAETPRLLAQGLKASGLSHSGKLVVVKVLTEVLLTDGRGEPLQQALDHPTIDIVKGSLLEGESRLHHNFVVGPDWEGQACTNWRLGVAFAGQGADQNRGRESVVPAGGGPLSQEPRQHQQQQPQLSEFVGGSEAMFSEGSGPVLETQGPLSLGPCSVVASRIAVEELARRMLELEALVFKQDTVVDVRWAELGRRRKWRTFVNNAQTAAQLLAAWGAFRDVIDWQAAQGCYSELDRRSFLSLLPAHARNSMPDAGDSVIYYGDGHAVSVAAEAKAGYKGVWGSDPPKKGVVEQHMVKSISYHQGGSSRRAKGAQPFATIELEPSPEPRSFEELGLLPQTEPFGKLNRLLKKAVKAMRERADVAHFLVPVSRSIYPDYYDVISEPMDLNKLWKRCSACRYRSVEEFKRELSLVASNCHLYCQDKFPSLPPAADAAVKVGMEFLDDPKMAAELASTVEDGNKLEGLWNKHMSAAISASPELATMPGMQKLARQLGFYTGTSEEDEGTGQGQESDEDDDGGQPDTASIARQVFYDKLVGIKYGTAPEDASPTGKKPPKTEEREAGRSALPSSDSPSQAPASSKDAAAAARSPTSASTPPPPASPPTATATSAPTDITSPAGGASGSSAADASTDGAGAVAEPAEADAPSAASCDPMEVDSAPAKPVTQGPPVADKPEVAAGAAAEAGAEGGGTVQPAAAAAGPLRVSMRLSNEMPEFVVVSSKYDDAMQYHWRSEMHIQMAFMEEPGEPPRIYEGTLVGVKPKDPRADMMPWESLMVEWDDEAGMNSVNPWEVEAVSAATAAARRRAPGMTA
ncbi:unnamed protein product [Scytosiphon promiscuus]